MLLNLMKILVGLAVSLFTWQSTVVENPTLSVDSGDPFQVKNEQWIDSTMASLSVEEKIGQLFMVAAYSNRAEEHRSHIEELISDYHIGGLIFFQGGPVRQANLTNHYQAMSNVPLMIGIDGEWGVGMRLDSVLDFPKQMALGAVQDASLLRSMGELIGQQCTDLGIHVNFAPVVVVNNNPKNPVIGPRSFGESPERVGELSEAYMLGLQSKHVMACAKHFPGHGDTDVDSHKDLPIIRHDRERLDSIELKPFRQLIDQGLASVMVAHIHLPLIDPEKDVAATLSGNVVSKILKSDLGFEGLIFTDALNMRGVADHFEPGELEVRAIEAGNDVLLFPEDVPTAVAAIKAALESGRITHEVLDERVRKILKAKVWTGAHRPKKIDTNGLISALNSPEAQLLNRELIERSITLLQNEDGLIPIQRLDTLSIATLTVTDGDNPVFYSSAQRYAPMDHYVIGKDFDESSAASIKAALADYNLVLASVHGNTFTQRRNYDVPARVTKLINEIARERKTIVTIHANAYVLARFFGLRDAVGVVMTYENNEVTNDLAAQMLFGAIPFRGKLPVGVSHRFPLGKGETTNPLQRFEYTLPEELGIDRNDLQGIRDIARKGIDAGAYPGCQILAAKDGKVFFYESMGHHKYDEEHPVENTDLYDLASITKIAATTPSIMYLQDRDSMHIDSTFGDYLPDIVDSTAYEDMVIRHSLAHQAGLTPWLPFYIRTLEKPSMKLKWQYYKKAPDEEFPYRVAEDLYITKEYREYMLNRIAREPVRSRKKYLYSDLGYYLLQEVIQRKTNKWLNEFVDETFYRPMGCATLTYKPREKFPLNRIVPTEDDTIFRKQLIHGDVHDQGAAMMGGVGGHAGLFSNANDLAKMMQMYINGGTYGGVRYIAEETLKEFTKCQFCDNDNRRGAGFDKPVRDGGPGPSCSCVSLQSFGHSGFTGTLAWADPESGVVYIFLSNRVYPVAQNPKIIRMDIRTDIQKVIYDAIKKAASKTGT